MRYDIYIYIYMCVIRGLKVKKVCSWRLSSGGWGYLPHPSGKKQTVMMGQHGCLLSSNDASNNRMKLPPSVKSSKYSKCGVSPTLATLPELLYVERVNAKLSLSTP